VSRNLCRTGCWYCHGRVARQGPVHLATGDDVGGHADEYGGRLWCAEAMCVDCEAKYLAWFNYPGAGDYRNARQPEVVDLSFRSTFDSKPGEADKPKWVIARTRTGEYTGGPWDYPCRKEDP